jgi:hypothetical protein
MQHRHALFVITAAVIGTLLGFAWRDSRVQPANQAVNIAGLRTALPNESSATIPVVYSVITSDGTRYVYRYDSVKPADYSGPSRVSHSLSSATISYTYDAATDSAGGSTLAPVTPSPH